MVELLYSFTIPVYGAVLGYALALSMARPHRRKWLGKGSTVLGTVFLLGAGLVGNFGHHVIGGFVADATDGRHGTLEAVVAIAFTAVAMPYCIGWFFRIDHRHESEEDANGSVLD